jgi:hypothetical protein
MPPAFDFSAGRLECELGATTSVTRSRSSGSARAYTAGRASPGTPGRPCWTILFASHSWFSCPTVHFGAMLDTLWLSCSSGPGAARPLLGGHASTGISLREPPWGLAVHSPAFRARTVSPSREQGERILNFFLFLSASKNARVGKGPRGSGNLGPKRSSASFVSAAERGRALVKTRDAHCRHPLRGWASVEQPGSLTGALEVRR